MKNYNFVVFAIDSSCFSVAYNDIIGLNNVVYIPDYRPVESKLINFLFRVHNSIKINKLLNLPFKRIWFKRILKTNFEDDNPICFIFFAGNLILEKYGYINYLKSKYPNSRYACYFGDLMHVTANIYKNFDIEKIKKVFDIVISYDYNEAKINQILYHPTPYSVFKINPLDTTPKCDIFFLGAAKKRLPKIIEVYKLFEKAGYRCDFYITGVHKKERSIYDGIHYISYMSYEENLQHVINSNCILELMQDNAVGYTMRTWESIIYDKKLITDNCAIINAPFYSEDNIFIINGTNGTIPQNAFFENFLSKVHYNIKEQFSPINFLEFISSQLNKK